MTEELNFYQRVALVQQELKAPKDQRGGYGANTFPCRSAEVILLHLKPLLGKYEMILIINDSIQEFSGRFYVGSKVKLIDVLDHKNQVEAVSYAREQASKKGMEEAQVTGGCSSYAKKYALQNLLAIDDSKDEPDMKQAPQPAKKITTPQINQINAIIPKIVGDNPEAQAEKVVKIQTSFSINTLADLNQDQFNTLIDGLSKQANG